MAGGRGRRRRWRCSSIRRADLKPESTRSSWRSDRHQDAGAEHHEPDARAEADQARSVLPLGESRRRGNERLVVDGASTRSGDVGPAGGLIFYDEPELRDGRLALSRGRALRSKRGRARGAVSARAIAGARGTAVGTGRQNTPTWWPRAPEPGTAAASVRHVEPERRPRVVPALARRTGADVPEPASDRHRRFSGLAASPTTSRTGRRRSRRPTWRRTSTSPISAACTATTRTSRGGCGPFGRFDPGRERRSPRAGRPNQPIGIRC